MIFLWSCITIFEWKSAKEYSKENLQKNIREKIHERTFEQKSAKTPWRKNLWNNSERKSLNYYLNENPRKSIRKKIHKECLSENLLWVTVPSESTTWTQLFYMVPHNHIWKKICERIFDRKSANKYSTENPRTNIRTKIRKKMFGKKIRETSEENPRQEIMVVPENFSWMSRWISWTTCFRLDSSSRNISSMLTCMEYLILTRTVHVSTYSVLSYWTLRICTIKFFLTIAVVIEAYWVDFIFTRFGFL
mgnify:CR=1 FL=1